MAIKPILMNSEMVRAILDGRKTCTRRKNFTRNIRRISREISCMSGKHGSIYMNWTEMSKLLKEPENIIMQQQIQFLLIHMSMRVE